MLTNNLFKRAQLHVIHALIFAPLYLAALVVPRKKSQWVFANRKGFVDNTRYLFEVAAQRNDIRAVWLAHSQELVKELQQQGYQCEYLYSSRGIWAALTASVGIICNGLSDLNWWTTGGMRIIQLWHGIPLKKIKLDYAPQALRSSTRWTERLVVRASFRLQRIVAKKFQFIVANSGIDQQRFATAFGLDESRIRILGSPRNAVILGKHPGQKQGVADLRNNNANISGRTILFAPTWREARIEYDWWRDFDFDEWNNALAELGATLLIKSHPFSRDGSSSDLGKDRIHWVDSLADVNRMLPNVDVLISDYSSIIFDFSLLGRPIIFFAPDLEVYDQAIGLYEPYSNVAQDGYCRSWAEVLYTIQRLFNDEAEWDRNCKRTWHLRDRYYSEVDGNDCGRIMAEIERCL